MIFLNCPSNAQIALQAFGRIQRLGQKRISNIWVLTSNYTYDQTLQHRAARKMMTTIAGQGSIAPTPDERKLWRLTHDSRYGECPIKFGSKYSQTTSGHKQSMRFCLLFKIKQYSELQDERSDGEAAALRLIRQRGISDLRNNNGQNEFIFP